MTIAQQLDELEKKYANDTKIDPAILLRVLHSLAAQVVALDVQMGLVTKKIGALVPYRNPESH